MEKIHKDALRKARIKLVRDLHPDAELWDMLVTETIFTPIMMEYIQAEKTRTEKVRRLLDDLVRRGPKAYNKFLKCLRDSGHEDLANTVEDNEYILRGLPVPLRPENQNVQGPTENVPTAPSTVTGQLTNSNSVEMSSEEVRVVQQSPVTFHQPSVEGETGPTSMAYSLMSHSASGSSIVPPTSSHMSQPSGETTMGSLPSQSGSYTGSSASEPSGSHTGVSAGQNGGEDEVDDDDDDDDDDVLMEAADAPAPEAGNVTQTAYQRALAERPTYKMESTPRGYCLIINNRDYTIDSLMDPRIGTDVNRDELRAMFIELGFQVDAKDNLTGQAMRDTLKQFAVYEGLTTVDSLVVAFLCHGDSEKMYGVDGVPLYLERDIFKVFSPRQCPVMIGKPKLFLINSCRGEQRDVGYSAPTTIGGTVPVDAAKTDVNPLCPRPRDENTVVPTFQDLYIAYSTFHGHVSYRNREEGSWYIRKLVEVFRAQAALCDIHALMTQVNREVTGIHDPQSMEVQVPAPCTTLTKDWYFNPPAAV